MRQTYARTILRCVARPVPHPICALTNQDELKGRIMMMSHDHSQSRRRAGRAFALLIAAGGMTLALPASAAPEKAAAEPVTVRKVIRISGVPGEHSAIDTADCQGEMFKSTAGSSEPKGKQTRILLCGKSGATKVLTADSLERALARIEQQSELNAEHKAQITAALKARIAELRAK